MKPAIVILALISAVTNAYANKPCYSNKHSCFIFNNQLKQSYQIKCYPFATVSSPANSTNTAQLDMGYGDGLGAPDPRTMNCQLVNNHGQSQPFTFYNPYWGSAISFTLASTKSISITIKDGWSKKTVHKNISL